MKTHQKFLQFNGKNIVFLSVEGTYWIALKPICEALNIDADSTIKRTQNDTFLGTCTANMTVQVGKNGRFQGRKMTCMSEKYIYGWICFLTGDGSELNEYKRTCYELLYNHFHGTITNRKELLIERNRVDTEIHQLKEQLKKQDVEYQALRDLQTRRKTLSTQLNGMDKELVTQPELFENTL